VAGSRLSLLLATPLLLIGGACDPAGAESGEETAIRAVIAVFDSAWSRKDTAVAAGLMSPDYVYFSSRGNVTPRQATLELLGAPHYRLEYADRSELEVHLFDGSAVVGSRWRGRGTYDGKEFVDDQRCSLTLGRGPRGWRLLSEHCTQIRG
jgi:ketosteroid isomerase-like protein